MEWVLVYLFAGLLWSAMHHKQGTKWHQHAFVTVAWLPLLLLNIVGWFIRSRRK